MDRWHAAGSRGATARRSWLKRLARHTQRGEFERVMAGRLPDNWHEAVAELKQDIADSRPKIATHASSQKCLETLVTATPELIGGSTGLTGSNLTLVNGMASISAGNFGGRHIHFGIREHGMAAAANGMALHGGIIPCVGTFFVFSDYLRPALRLSAIMRQRVVYVLTHDCHRSRGGRPDASSGRASRQPARDAQSARVPARRRDGDRRMLGTRGSAVGRTQPSRAVVPDACRRGGRIPSENRSARGGYVLAEADGPRQATIIATGSEVTIAMAARAKLAGDNITVAVVSLPCWELFAQQDAAYRAQVLGGAPRVGIEAAGGFGWEQWLRPEGTFIGMTGFGASGRYEDLYTHFGITPEAVVAAVTRRLG